MVFFSASTELPPRLLHHFIIYSAIGETATILGLISRSSIGVFKLLLEAHLALGLFFELNYFNFKLNPFLLPISPPRRPCIVLKFRLTAILSICLLINDLNLLVRRPLGHNALKW